MRDEETEATSAAPGARDAPDEPHGRLAELAGSWRVCQRFREAPGAFGEEIRALAEHRVMLGGRFVRLTLHGEVRGQPFEGIGYLGYERLDERYVLVWMDTATTRLAVRRGASTDDGRTIVLEGEDADPATGRARSTRLTLSIVDRDHYVVEIAAPGAGGEFVAYRAEYERC